MADNLVSGGLRSLGEAGQVGPIGLGIWRMTVGSTADHVALLESAADLGATLLDTADVYGLDWGGSGFGACEAAVMTHGGMGYAKEYHVERYMREVMIPRLAPVSPQMILNFIAERVLGLPKSY